MSESFDTRLDAYLDGELSLEETARFEEELLDRPAADALAAELFLRDFLATTGPDEPPAHLADTIEAALVAEGLLRTPKASRGLLPEPSAALVGASWAVRGPALAVSRAGSSAPYGASEAFAGMGTLRYALGPLRPAKPRRKQKRRPLWRRAWGLVRRVS